MNQNSETTPASRRYCRTLSILLLFGALLLFGSCSSRASLNLDPRGSGTAEIVVDLDPVFVSYFRDLAGSMGSDENVPIFDLRAVAARFEEERSLTLLSASTPAQGRLELRVGFEELSRLAEDARFGRILSYSEAENGTSRLSIRLAPEDVPFLLSLSGLKEGSPVELLLPPPEGEMSAEEYREYLIWALEEYESPGRLRQILNGAAVSVTVNTPDAIVSITNGSQLGPQRARFRIALLPLVTGEHEGLYELRY